MFFILFFIWYVSSFLNFFPLFLSRFHSHTHTHRDSVFEGFEISPSAALSLSLNSRSLSSSISKRVYPPNQNKVLNKFLCFSISKLLFFFLFCWFWLVGTLPIQYSSNWFLFFSLDHINVYVLVCFFFFFFFGCSLPEKLLCFYECVYTWYEITKYNMIYYLAYYMLPFATNNNILYNQFFLWWCTEILSWLVFSVSHHKYHVWVGWSSGYYWHGAVCKSYTCIFQCIRQ